MDPSFKPIEVSFPFPRNPHAIIHAHITFLTTSITVLLTTSTIGDSSMSLSSMGSFVYAMPDRTNRANVISTPLYTTGSSIDYALRTAKILARKTQFPVYLTCSMNLSGLTIEEEMECLSKVVNTITAKWDQHQAQQRSVGDEIY